MNRRHFLLAAGGAALLSQRSWAFGDVTLVDVAQLDLGGLLKRPNAWKRLLFEVESTTSVEVNGEVAYVKPEDPELFEHPFTVLVGREGFTISDEGAEQLSRYLAYGGFLFIDDASGADTSDFDTSVRRLTRKLFPTRQLAQVPRDHSLYRAFFLVRRPVGRLARHRHLEAVTVGNLAPLVYSRNDLSGALDRRDNGQYVSSCVPGGASQRREALKLGINLVMYSLTANYKRDQAHVVTLKREGRLE